MLKIFAVFIVVFVSFVFVLLFVSLVFVLVFVSILCVFVFYVCSCVCVFCILSLFRCLFWCFLVKSMAGQFSQLGAC